MFHGGPLEAGFPVVLGVDAREIAGRKVEVDAGGKLLPWPMAGDVGYSYAGYALSQWTVLQDQLERQKLPWARRDAAGNVHYLFGDQIGSARTVTNSSGVSEDVAGYYPYGQPTTFSSFSSGNLYKFTGKELDAESGLDYFGARYMASTMGRFMSPDYSDAPVAVPFATLSNPQTLNLYSYLGNNPLSLTDPFGHNWFTQLFKDAGQSINNAVHGDGLHTNATVAKNKEHVTATVLTPLEMHQREAAVLNATIAVQQLAEAFQDPISGEETSNQIAAEEEQLVTVNLEIAADEAAAAGPPINTSGFGNIGGGSTTAENALAQGSQYLGPGAKEIAPGVFRSADGTRQFRMTTGDITGAHGNIGPHLHFESIGSDGRTITENSHVGITNP